MQGGAALTLGSALGVRHATAADTTIGFIYVGPRDDYGYNQAHAQGAAALKKMAGRQGRRGGERAETVAVEKTMECMINLDGATLVFPTSFGYFDPHMLKMAEKYPKVHFRHCGGLWTEQAPEEHRQLFRLHRRGASTSPASSPATPPRRSKLGFVAAKPIPQVLRNINAFTLGAQVGNPKTTTQVIFTGDWSLPVKEAEATNSLIDQGVDVVTCHVDSPKVMVETAARRGIISAAITATRPLAPKGYLTGAEWNWEEVYPKFVKMMKAGEPCRTSCAAASRKGSSRSRPTARRSPRRRARTPTPSRRSS